MSTATPGVLETRESVLSALRDGERFALVTHEHPDGDALGSLIAMQRILVALGKDSVAFITADDFPLGYEYRWLDLEGITSELPDDLAERTVVFLDCGNIDRNPVEEFRRPEATILNIDHHHDNTRFGTVAHVVEEASCTAEIVWDLMRGLGVELTPVIAEALYVGLVTDTGRFSYENTGPSAHMMAADLIAAGVDVALVYRRVYEGWPEAKLRLVALALSRARVLAGGALALTQISHEDFLSTGADDGYTEGIVDRLRAVEGTKVAALARELSDGSGRWKVSLRSSDGEVDVSMIARAGGGGGHKAAAGFTTELSTVELATFLQDQVVAQL
jgi:phosphoesterase RecJ-like protein